MPGRPRGAQGTAGAQRASAGGTSRLGRDAEIGAIPMEVGPGGGREEVVRGRPVDALGVAGTLLASGGGAGHAARNSDAFSVPVAVGAVAGALGAAQRGDLDTAGAYVPMAEGPLPIRNVHNGRGARGRDAGDPDGPMFTLQASSPHGVAFTVRASQGSPRAQNTTLIAAEVAATVDTGGWPDRGGGDEARLVVHAEAAGPVAASPERGDPGDGRLVAHALTARADGSEDGTGRGAPLVPVDGPVAVAVNQRREGRMGPVVGAVTSSYGSAGQFNGVMAPAAGEAWAVADAPTPRVGEGVAPTLLRPSPSGGGHPAAVAAGPVMLVRRLTPMECERLQGLPDGWTALGARELARLAADPRLRAAAEAAYRSTAAQAALRGRERRPAGWWPRLARRHAPSARYRVSEAPPAWRPGRRVRWLSDQARYRMIGNAVAVPVVHWLAARLVAAMAGEDPEAATPTWRGRWEAWLEGLGGEAGRGSQEGEAV
ncbi:MAG: hypothetical protein K6U87_06200 [Firmicutes bacterium]|nr:hypothetical protein [Bacillota bacterium]